jgi:cytochrome c oxidase subunit 2
VRRRSIVAGILVLVAVLLAGSWFGWGRDGLTPVKPAATGADEINELYRILGAIAALVLLSVIVPLALILGRYRARELPREVEGPQIRGNTPLELTWTAIPLVIVLALSGIALWKAIEIQDPATAAGEPAELQVTVDARQFYWRFVYENGALSIDTLRLPVGRVTAFEIVSPPHDVVHSFWVPAMGAKMDAIPGQVNELKLKPTRTGTFVGKCAELCGIQHAKMEMTVEVLSQAEFDRWMEEAAGAQQQPNAQFGEQIFTNVCTKCHFAAPEYAPNIAGNPLLSNDEGMRTLLENGRRRMPAVGKGWTEQETASLLEYLKTIAPPPQTGSDGG